MRISTYILSVIGILFFVSKTFGQDTTHYLKPIPVFAQKDSILRISILTSSIPHFELTRYKLDEIGATDVGEALKFIPGIQMRDYGGIGGVKTITYRSLGAAHTAVQIDGSQIPNVQSGTINLSSFELFGLEKVVFSSGRTVDSRSSATAYLLANTIALESVLASAPKKMRIGIYSNSTTINAFENGFYAQKKIGEKYFAGLQTMLRFGSGTYSFQHPELPESELLKRENTALFNYRFRFVTGYNSDKNKITLAAFYANNTQELPGAAVLFNPSNDQKLWNKDWRINAKHTYQRSKWNLQSHANFQSNYTRYLDPHFLNLQGFIDVDYLQNTYSAGSIWKREFRFPSEKIFIGADVIYSDLASSSILSNPTRLQQNNVLGAATLLKRFKLEANITTQLIYDSYIDNATNTTNTFFKASPFVAIAYLFPSDNYRMKNAKLRLRSFYKNTFRMPTFNDLYYNFIGNTKLKPEDASLFNFGVTYGFKKKAWLVELTTDAYYTKVKNKIIAIPTKDLFNWSMQNIGITAIKGVDIGAILSIQLKKTQLTIATNHSFNESLDITNKTSITYKQQIPYTPYYSNNSSLSIAKAGYKISTNILFNGFRYSLNENIYANYLPAYTDMNIGVSKQFKIKKALLLVDLKAMNIFNKNYQVIRSFPVPGRHYQLRLKYTFDK